MQTQKVIDHIVNWLKDYAVKAKVNGYVIGVSGGVDSGVVSTFCAMTGLKFLRWKCRSVKKADQVNRAQDHIEDLKKKFPNVKSETVNLTPVLKVLKILSAHIQKEIPITIWLLRIQDHVSECLIYIISVSFTDF
jgi:NAD+ synthase